MSDIRIQNIGEPDILQTSGRKLITLPNREIAPVRPWDVAPTSLQLALARGDRWVRCWKQGKRSP